MRRGHACALCSTLLTVLAVAAGEREAHATNVTEFPDNGSEQMGRGGAWVARASDPLATAFNPAGLAGQPSRLTLQSNFIVHRTCMTRLKSANDTTFLTPTGGNNDPLVDPSGHYPRVCNDIEPNINPQLAATLKVNDRLGLGVAVLGPSSAGEKNYPEFVEGGDGQLHAAPQRYLLTRQAGIVLFPTIGVGYEVIDNLRIGASVAWGVAKLKTAAATVALNSDNTTSDNDVRANIQFADYFIPRFSLGALYSATPEIDIAAWYQWTDAIRASGDVGIAANYYTRANARGDESSVRYGDTIFPDCGTGRPQDEGKCGDGDNAKVKITLPMEAKIGIRYHKPRVQTGPDGEAVPPQNKRDPMANDVFDVELDLTWANNSAIDALQIRFPGDPTGRGLLPVSGIDGAEIPPNADQRRNYKDVFGIRFGGDYVVLPDQLALRAGVFYETSALDERFQHLDFAPSARFGVAGGASYRILTNRETRSALEIMLGFGHVFFADMTREDPNAEGLPALAGTSCNNSTAVSPDACADGAARYRTKWPVNLGTITNSLNVVNVGLAYRF